MIFILLTSEEVVDLLKGKTVERIIPANETDGGEYSESVEIKVKGRELIDANRIPQDRR